MLGTARGLPVGLPSRRSRAASLFEDARMWGRETASWRPPRASLRVSRIQHRAQCCAS